MRIVCGFVLLLALASAPASAATKDCQSLKSLTVRQACLDRQAAEHPGQAQQGASSMGDAVERMKREDDLLAKHLRNICRGC